MDFPFGAFTPDLPALAGGGDKAYNVIPAAQSYRSVSGLAVYSSNVLANRCQGAAVYQDNSGNVNGFAGDVSKLWRITAGATTFADVSGTTYATAVDGRWRFTQYGNRVIATNFANAIQSFVIGTSAVFADLSAGAPKAKDIIVAKNFAIAANTFDGTDGNQPQRIWWSKQGDTTSWPTPGTSAAIAALSDKRDLAGDTGSIQGLAAGLTGADVAVFAERGLYAMRFTAGSDQIFNIDLVEGARGTPAPGSIVQVGGIVYYLGQDGFYAFNGVQALPIGASMIDKFFFSDPGHGVDQANLFRMSSVADVVNKVVMWAYPSVAGGAGIIDRVLCYNWEVNKWSLLTGLGNLEILTRMYSIGYSLETLDSLGNIDTLPYSLDSRQLTGGQLLLGAFKGDHGLYTFSGPSLAATMTTTEAPHPTGRFFEIYEARPNIEVSTGAGITGVPAITVTPLTRDAQMNPLATGTPAAVNSQGFSEHRTNARFQAFQVDIAAGDATHAWGHATGVRIPEDKLVVGGDR